MGNGIWWVAAGVMAVVGLLLLVLGDKPNQWNRKIDRAVGLQSARMNPKVTVPLSFGLCAVLVIIAIVKS